MNRRSAEQAELASRAKSRFLTDDEPRAAQPAERHPRAAGAARAERPRRAPAAAGRPGAAVGPVDAADADRGCSTTARCRTAASSSSNEPFRLAGAGRRRSAESLAAEGAGASRSTVRPGHAGAGRRRSRPAASGLRAPDASTCSRAATRPAATVALRPRRRRTSSARSPSPADGSAIDWKLDLLMGLSEIAPDQVTAEALRPLIARGLIAADAGRADPGRRADDGRRVIRVDDARRGRCGSSRSACTSRPARRRSPPSTRRRCAPIGWSSSPPDSAGPVDVVLVDSTSVGEAPLMSRLRARFPGALFVSLGLPQSAGFLRRHRRDAERHVAPAHQHPRPARLLGRAARLPFAIRAIFAVSYAEIGLA